MLDDPDVKKQLDFSIYLGAINVEYCNELMKHVFNLILKFKKSLKNKELQVKTSKKTEDKIRLRLMMMSSFYIVKKFYMAKMDHMPEELKHIAKQAQALPDGTPKDSARDQPGPKKLD